MTVKEFVEASDFEAISLPEPDKAIDGAYIGDLLSWVMGRARSCSAWITIMTNINVVAVATLADTSCVILAEGVTPEDEVVRSAMEKGVNILKSPLPSYETAVRFSEIISRS